MRRFFNIAGVFLFLTSAILVVATLILWVKAAFDPVPLTTNIRISDYFIVSFSTIIGAIISGFAALGCFMLGDKEN